MRYSFLNGFDLTALDSCPDSFTEADLVSARTSMFLGLSVFLRDDRMVHAQATNTLKEKVEALARELEDVVLANHGERSPCNIFATLLKPKDAASLFSEMFITKAVVDKVDAFLVDHVFSSETLDFTAFVDQGIARGIFQDAVGFQHLSMKPQETLSLDQKICVLRDAITISKTICEKEAPKILAAEGVTLGANEVVLSNPNVQVFLQQIAQMPTLLFRVVSQYPTAFSIFKRMMAPSLSQTQDACDQQIAHRNRLIIGLSIISVSLGVAYYRLRKREPIPRISDLDYLRARTPSDFDPSKRYARDDLPAPRK